MESIDEQKKAFLNEMEKRTTLKASDVGGLVRAYGIDEFFKKHERRIVEKSLGGDVARAFLRLTKIRAIRKDAIPALTVGANGKLVNALRDWIFVGGIEEQHEDEPPAGPKPWDTVES